jgi:NADH dehydrogenase [ubiquinone] 1 alpha subcomplex assembly factor 7
MLRERLAARIRRSGPLRIDEYMRLCLHDPDEGYYATRPDLGAAGDFVTAPLVSQMFGELLGLWAAQVWLSIGAPTRVSLIELGPGLGVMMSDVLRAARRAPGFLDAAEIWLMETSAPLRARQAEALAGLAAPRWAADLQATPQDVPAIVLANEFLDCLPIRQAVRTAEGWREQVVALAADGGLAFALGPPPPAGRALPDTPVGLVAEWSDEVEAAGAAIGERVRRTGGAALMIDYGRDAPGPGDTLQALRRHRKECPLARPGEADLTAHVDFPAFLTTARSAGASARITTQARFLEAMGVRTRAAALARARPDRAAAIGRQLERLIAPGEMGVLFKVAAVSAPGLVPPGFEGQS